MNGNSMKKTIICLVALFSSCSLQKSAIIREIEVRSVLDLDELSPKVDIIGGMLFSRSFFSVDQSGNLFFLDPANHRVLKYTKEGEFIGQIGGIGQGKEDLFNPLGLYIKDDQAFILNNAGKELKIFSAEGAYISSFKIENGWRADSLCVDSDFIYVGVRYLDEKNYNQHGLITVFDKQGRRIDEMGKIILCASRIGYLHFNNVFLSMARNKIFGAFKNRPIIFCYGTDGKEQFYINLEKAGIEEVRGLIEKEKSEGFDTPETKKTDGSLRMINYCRAFGADKKGNFYYSIWSTDNQHPYIILQFNNKGKLVKKFVLKSRGRSIIAECIFIDSRGKRWGIGKAGENIILFQF